MASISGIDWPLDAHGNHPLTELLLADFMVVDVSEPVAEDGCYFEIEQSLLKGAAYKTCGGRWLNDHSMDTFSHSWSTTATAPRLGSVSTTRRSLPLTSSPISLPRIQTRQRQDGRCPNDASQ